MNRKTLEEQLAEARATIAALQEELAETNRGLVALSMELEQRVEARTELLSESEQRFRSFVEAIAQVVWTTNARGEVDMAIPAWQAYTGQTAEQARGFGWMDAIRPADRARVADAWKNAVQTGGLYQVEYLLRVHDGSWRNILARGVPVRDSRGNIREYLGVCIDITARKQAEEALQQSEERFRTMANAIPQLAWMAKADGWIYWYNQRWYEYTGTTPEQMEGWGWQSVHDPQALPEVLRRWKASIARGEPFDMIFPLRGADGVYRPFLSRGVPFKDKHGSVLQWFGTNTDISEQKAAEEELAAAKASAEQAKAAAEQANRTKDHFLAVLSHELRTPLTPVMMALSMLQQRRDLDEQVRAMLEMVHRNVEMEARLIDDLLDVSRISRGKVELNRSRIELCTVIQRAVEVCRPDIEARRLHFGVDLGNSAPYCVEADPSRLQQVLWNLLKNAIKFTPHDGCVGIRCQSADSHVIVSVSDSGIGIEPDALPRVFNAFEQVERSITRQFGGLGLGLAISKALVEMHGGTITAESEGRDKGATFSVRLPLCAAGDRAQVSSPPPPPLAVQPLRILLVEDHGVTAKMIQLVLTAEGHLVHTAGDVATALEACQEHPFDLVISDLGLPDGNGHDLLRKLRQRGCTFPGIAISGYGQEDDLRRSYEAGFAAHLTKPASREQLLQAVAAVGGSRPASGQPASASPGPAEQRQADLPSPVFDFDEALRRCADDRELFGAMVAYFFEDVETVVDALRAALAAGDADAMAHAAHRFKGTVSYLGAAPATQVTQAVEEQARSGDLSSAGRRIDELARQLQLLKQSLAPYRPASPLPPASSSSQP